ncbi:MAG: hypothetical protein OEQ39_09640 [Gammaproteobacteria bacterium]|nr:hypothetical protein [Gammaproteobacteria bacterium]MDH3468259.1 hypothetical protein [Gammaproteobacteria bacterium]
MDQEVKQRRERLPNAQAPPPTASPWGRKRGKGSQLKGPNESPDQTPTEHRATMTWGRCCSSTPRPRFVSGQVLYVDGGITATQ